VTLITISQARPAPSRLMSVLTRTRHPHQAPPGILHIIATATVLLAGMFVLGWSLLGGRLLFMETPSMCPSVCVGSLVADRPLSGELHVGELITFHPPGIDTETYTHEIWRILPNGVIQTRGVGNRVNDPWLITRSEIVGKGVFSVWGAGWLLKALPFMTLIVLCWAVGRLWVRGKVRQIWDCVWMTSLVSLPLLAFRPLMRGDVTSTSIEPAHHGWLTSTIVNTGLLPATFWSKAGTVLPRVGSGQIAHLSGSSAKGGAVLYESASLNWWEWALVVLVVISPFLRYLWQTWRAYEAPRAV
jgi:hypothetical protein